MDHKEIKTFYEDLGEQLGGEKEAIEYSQKYFVDMCKIISNYNKEYYMNNIEQIREKQRNFRVM